MSNGDEDAESAAEPESEAETEPAEEDTETQPDPEEFDDPAAFETRLDEAESALEAAETEPDLDDVEATLDEIEDDLADAEFFVPEPEDEDDDPEDPRDDLDDRLSDLRDDLEDQRGPYVSDIVDVLEDAQTTITSSKWTEKGEGEVSEAVERFFGTTSETLDWEATLEASDPEDVNDALAELTESIGDTELDPDDDADAIATLLDAANDLTGDLEDAQVWSDLEVREQLRRQGFYDVLTPETRRDFPPEWNAIKIYEKEGEVEPILTAMESLGSDFMEENILDALEHLAPEEAFEQVHALAQRRNKQPVRILGRIGDERACETLHDFLGGGDVKLELVSLRALGTIGSEDSTEPVAQRLAADNPDIRSTAARALGLIGDTRAIDPLAEVLETDDADAVRASAAWALNQIGTERALAAAADYDDDRSYLVQVEAENAARS
ncbi:HEAT repeat domain-containing protein [Halovenus marina]|uniref:HEAT repeat domain-containing protein n=1 Tax=Halovenus marina TaxID=3396621 RepID=UPI003F55DA58